MTSRISNAAAIAACNGIVDLLDAGTIQIRSGSQPASVDTTATGTLLAALTLGDPAFGDAANASPGGIATANAITDDTSADAAGTASWFRALDSSGNAVIDGDVTVTGGGGDMTLNSIKVIFARNVEISSWTFTVRGS